MFWRLREMRILCFPISFKSHSPSEHRLQNRMWLSTTLEVLGRVMRRRLSKNTEKHVDEVSKQCQGTNLPPIALEN